MKKIPKETKEIIAKSSTSEADKLETEVKKSDTPDDDKYQQTEQSKFKFIIKLTSQRTRLNKLKKLSRYLLPKLN